jgi:GntR family transcriptional regulator/MocR family aminotransferase
MSMAANQRTESQTNLAWDTLLDLGERDGGGPLHQRLTHAIRAAIRTGTLPNGAALPPSRKLAADLGCSRWAVTEAYQQLVAEGYLVARVGSATRVRWPQATSRPAPATAAGPARTARYDLGPGLPDLRAFPRQAWAEAVRAEVTTAPHAELAYPARGAPGGHPRLRQVLAEYLQRVRGAIVDPEDVTITSGVTDGVARLCRALLAAGAGAVAVEDPGWHRLREAAGGAGLALAPVGVDDQGIRVQDLPKAGAAAAIVSPAHQFPTGSVLAPARRAALLEWARRVDALVLEDDYDAEFRYDRRPVGTLQGMDPRRVALLGSLSKTLAPAMGLGWVVTPPRWTQALRAAQPRPAGPPVLDQLALARFIQAGSYDRHLRSVRQRYRARRDRLVRALGRELPDCPISGVAAGLHIVVRLPRGTDAAAVVAGAARRGVRVVAMDAYRAAAGPGQALVLGYGNLDDRAVEQAVRELAAAVRAAPPSAVAGTRR